jgi:transposase
MLKLRPGMKVYVSVEPIDMRCAVNGLSVRVAELLEQSPQSGHLFLFFNKSRDKVKILFWDRNGFALHYKRLEKHRFYLPSLENNAVLEINEFQLHGLLAGLDYRLMGDFPEINCSNFY